MSHYDFRKKTENEKSFYVFDDLRFSQNPQRLGRGSSDIFYYDTLEEALAKYHDIPHDMTPALGMHRSRCAELDLVHRRNGSDLLVSDYKGFKEWRQDRDVCAVVSSLCSKLNIAWEMNSKLIPRATIATPIAPWFQWLPEKALLNKSLHPQVPKYYREKVDPLSAMNEAYVIGEGWLPYTDFRKKAESFGFADPKILFTMYFNVNYIDNSGEHGQIDVTPADLQILLERYTLQHGKPDEVHKAADLLAKDLDEFAWQHDTYEYKDQVDIREDGAQLIRDQILAGNTEGLVAYLRQVIDECSNMNDEDFASAYRLLARVEGISAGARKPALQTQISVANIRHELSQETPSHNLNAPERN